MCKVKINTDYCGIPKALLSFGGTTVNIFPELNKTQQRKIKKTYDLEMDVSLPIKKLRTIFPTGWGQHLHIRREIKKLPLHRITVPWMWIK